MSGCSQRGKALLECFALAEALLCGLVGCFGDNVAYCGLEVMKQLIGFETAWEGPRIWRVVFAATVFVSDE